ncbi:MAG: bifunctional tRNA (5-methylaminomethyl-2-thiouridine)(34)-methyltransferase MnmD/FAD-dependent 5-carboxymethylaminomethyl-2-thiouridine(34) oxidoreductase MnmC [Robiginitomaculum sp.]|nr:MAG: bifunctional tRNA (5-methylaminomethyl-2-thiouridine)(34)-methyltransferase MnmD/FAD-dependent 5-carboxymethylaminomethyl-2-thiouridine(34) oxidoreductase MnmC [Robiginitomaculum sp.]
MSDLFLGLPTPRLNWSKGGVPHNLDHEDGYFSDQDGLNETCTVFLKGCHLPGMWQDKTRFTIAELGFGTGLNFLQTWDLWRKSRPGGARLHFISIEGAPFGTDDLRRAHEAFTPLHDLAKKLRAQWPDNIKGVHRLFFDEDGIALTLYFMDVDEAMPQMESHADCWYLDGFAPSRNAAMWSGTVFTHMARLSRTGTRAATFSVAGAVRRGLQSAGFTITREPGHGRKRERLEAVFAGAPSPPLRRPSRPHALGNPAIKSVLVIGGGIAGASIAHGFLRRGLNVTMICKAGLGDEASGNPAALVSPRLDLEDTPQTRFFRTAFHHAAKTYDALGDQIWTPCGLIRRPAHPSDVQKFSRLVAARPLPETALCADKDGPGMSLPGAGTVIPTRAIAAMTRDAHIIEGQVSTVTQKNGLWAALNQENQPIAHADITVLALGSGTLDPVSWLSFQYLKGQVSQGMLDIPYGGPALLAESYALGRDNGSLVIGATFDEIERPGDDLFPNSKDQERNLAALRTLSPALFERLDKTQITSRASVRATTPDQMPYVGSLIDVGDFLQRFCAYRHGFLDPKVGKAQMLDNLFVLMGLGSRGFALAPILGEAIAAEALGEPSPLERVAAQAMHPARVLERRLKASGQINKP